MSVLKCKMCGADLNINEDCFVAECEYCGAKQTVPVVNDEKKINMFNIANRLRMNSEFDKAGSIYEQIIAEFPEEAEAYWGLCLCNYGIEYVDDPATYKKMPTVHRASFEKLHKDENYELAVEYADIAAKAVYQSEAKEIDRIMGEILSISKNETPYDIFICYKESDNTGDRTPDSVVAQDIYDALTEKGYKVFFSRITLEDKLGQQYEPYIFAALNSAKVMLAIGTDYEHYNAVWVKNEWSRFIKLMAKDKSKVLIPCFKDMDAYDMPDEFKGLQAQDMSKLGFMQDLLRGIDKIFGKDKIQKREDVIVNHQGGNASIDSLLKRAFMFLKDEEWKSADEYCERVLDIDPENANAYLGKLMVEYKIGKEEDLKSCYEPIRNSKYYSKACDFDSELAKKLKSYNSAIDNRIGNMRKQAIYDKASAIETSAKTEEEYKHAADEFKSINGFKDAESRAACCLKEAFYAEMQYKQETYSEASEIAASAQNASDYRSAAEKFYSIRGFNDAETLANKYFEKAKAAENLRKQNVYEEALKLMRDASSQEQINNAIRVFSGIIDYKDAKERIIECDTLKKKLVYDNAGKLFAKANNDEAFKNIATMYNSLGEYKDAKEKADLCNDKIKSIKEAVIKKKKRKKAFLIAIPIILVFSIICNIVISKVIIPKRKYSELVEKYGSDLVDDIYAAEVGSTFTFGSFEQDDDLSNGKEQLEWIVIGKGSPYSMRLLCKDAIACMQFDDCDTTGSLESSTLIKWLNNDFLNQTFSKEEQKMIVQQLVNVCDISLLDELDESVLSCDCTLYAVNNAPDDYTYQWWTYRYGSIDSTIHCYTVSFNGNIHDNDEVSPQEFAFVRPVIQLHLE